MRTNREKSGDSTINAMRLVLIAIVLLGLGCQRRTPPSTEKTVMQLDTFYRSDSSVVVVRPGESIRLGESREEMMPDAQMMGSDLAGKTPPSAEITYVQKGDSVRLGEGSEPKR